jgi:hypothetical protein
VPDRIAAARANPVDAESLAVCYRQLVRSGVAGVVVQVLLSVSGLSVKVRDNAALLNLDQNVKKINLRRTVFEGELNMGIDLVGELDELVQALLTVRPDAKNVIYIPPPAKWLIRGLLKQGFLKGIHEDYGVTRCRFGPHGSAGNLCVVFFVECEVVELQDNLS